VPNYSYFPVIFESEEQLLEIEKHLNKQKIYPRRYFYPSVNTYSNIVEYQECPVSENIAIRILCLPLYWELNENEMKTIIETIKSVLL
jgi:dTDP-4-amino-4,6-dideoxygalactose transaminase